MVWVRLLAWAAGFFWRLFVAVVRRMGLNRLFAPPIRGRAESCVTIAKFALHLCRLTTTRSARSCRLWEWMPNQNQVSKTMKQMLLVLVTVSFNVVGQYLMKRGMMDVGRISGDMAMIVSSVTRAFLNPWVMAGVIAYGMSSIFWLVLLSRVDLSYAYPALSLGYVLVTLISAFALGEQVSGMRWAGVLVICVGVALLSRS